MSGNGKMTTAEFDQLYEEVKNWGRWGQDDTLGTLNYLTPDRVKAATALVTSGRSVTLSLPVNTLAGPDNPHPAIHLMAQTHDYDFGSGEQRFATDFFGMEFHGDSHSHLDALCHVAYRGKLYNGIPADTVTSRGGTVMTIDDYRNGIVGRGVLIDIPRLRGVPWLEPGVAVTSADIEDAEDACGVRLSEGDVMVFRTGHHRRRLEQGAWDSSVDGRAGLHPTAMRLFHERKVAAFAPDGDGETLPSPVEGLTYPIHPLQLSAMGMTCMDSLQLENVAKMCEEEHRWEFLFVAAPLRLTAGTGSPVNPIAVF